MTDARTRPSKEGLAQGCLVTVIVLFLIYIALPRILPSGAIESAYYLHTYVEACGLQDGVRTWQYDRKDPDGWPDLSWIDTDHSAVPCYYGPHGSQGEKPDSWYEPHEPQETSPGIMP